jgi:hypothetical protein
MIAWLWNKLHRKKRPLSPGSAFPFSYATSFCDLEVRIHELVPNLHGDLNIAYQPRLPPKEQEQFQRHLDDSRFLVLIGRTGIGKTREGLESLRRLEKQLAESVTVLCPRAPFTASFATPPGLSTNHIVLFIDNLHDPPFSTPAGESADTATAGDFPTWFRECLRHFGAYADFRVVAIARSDTSGKDYQESVRNLRPILDEFHFQESGCHPGPRITWTSLSALWQTGAVSQWMQLSGLSWPAVASLRALPTTPNWRCRVSKKEAL